MKWRQRESEPLRYGRMEIPLPNGGVRIRLSENRLELAELREVRHWWFWRKTRTYVLAEGEYTAKVGETLTLQQRGKRYLVTALAADAAEDELSHAVLEWTRPS